MNKTIFFPITASIIVIVATITGCAADVDTYPLQLKEWRIAPATAAVTPGLSALAGTDADDAVIQANYAVNCYNNMINSGDARLATNIYRGIPAGGSNNLARNKTVYGGINPENATSVPNDALSKSAKGKTFIDSNFNSFATLSPDGGSFVLDLDSIHIQCFDRMDYASLEPHFFATRPQPAWPTRLYPD